MANENKTTVVEQPELLEGQGKLSWQLLILKYNSLLLLAALILVSSLMSPFFFSYTNLVNILRQQNNYIMISMGLMVLMAAGGVDLGLAALVGMGQIMTTELLMVQKWSIGPTMLGVIVSVTVIGALSGWLVAYVGMAPFIVTLCMSYNLTGVAFLVTRGVARQLAGAGSNIAPGTRLFLNFGQLNDPIIGLPWRFYLSLAMILVTWFVMTRTKFGRLMIATGSNPIASRLAGIDIRRYRMSGFMIAAFACGLCGFTMVAQTASSSSTVGGGDYTMIAMAATIMGGSSLEGGGGSVPFTVVGIFIMGLINNIMNLANVPAYPQYIVKACIILFSIFMRGIIDAKT